MYSFNPQGTNLRALEQNILKYRTFEMVMILFYVEEMRTFTLRSIQVTDEMTKKHSNQEERLPAGTKKIYKKLWQILVDEEVLTLEEKDRIIDLSTTSDPKDYFSILKNPTLRKDFESYLKFRKEYCS